MPRYHSSALIQSPENSILSIWMLWLVPARSPSRSMDSAVEFRKSGRDWSRGRSYWVTHHSGTANSPRPIVSGFTKSLGCTFTELNFEEFESWRLENLGSKLRMAKRTYRALPAYRMVRFRFL